MIETTRAKVKDATTSFVEGANERQNGDIGGTLSVP